MPNTRNIVLAAFAALALAALYAVLRPAEPAAEAPAVPPPAEPAASATVAPATEVTQVSVDRPANIRIAVRAGDAITLDVTSSKRGMVSAHGLSHAEYPVEPAKVTRVTLATTVAGMFALHFHGEGGEHVPLAVIEVGAGR